MNDEIEKFANEFVQGFDYAIELSPNQKFSLKKDKALSKASFKTGYNKALEEFKSMLLHLMEKDEDFRKKFIGTLREDDSFIRVVGEAYHDYDEIYAW